MFLCRSLRWSGFVAKFAMPDFATGIRNVPAGSQRRCGEKDHGDDQRCGRPWPFYRRDDGDSSQGRERVKDPDEILRAVLMFIEPAFPIFISHRQNAIVSLLAKLINWPCGQRADEYQRQRGNLS